MLGYVKKALCFVFLLGILLCICSCGSENELKLSNQVNIDTFELPEFEGQDKIIFNELLANKMNTIGEVFEEVSMKGLPFHAVYTLNDFTGRESKLLNVSIKDSRNNNELFSYDMHLDLKKKSVRYKESAASQLVENKKFLENYILLRQLGIELQLMNREKVIDKAQWVAMLASAFEAFAGIEIDTEKIDESLTKETAIKKALEVDIIDVKDLEELDKPIKRQNAIVYYLSFVKEIEERLYAHACQTATTAEARDLLSIVCKMQKKEMINNVTSSYQVAYNSKKALTRLELANIIMSVYEEFISAVPVVSGRDTLFTDTKSTSANKAVSCGVMNYFANNNTFLPYKELQFWEIITPLKNFVLSSLKHEKEDADVLNFEDSVELLALGIAPYISKEKVEGQEIVVLNERPYSWYCNQLKTGKYSKVNCVPSCVEMALVWRDKDIAVTAEHLREMTLANGQGWNGKQMINAIKAYGVEPVAHTPATLDSIKKSLDEGSLIILMINEGGANEGHAIVIKGYRQNKAGIWFILNDPFSANLNKYGLPSGQDREMEGEYLAFVCSRFTNTFFEISPKNN